jgi:hypothetical protein
MSSLRSPKRHAVPLVLAIQWYCEKRAMTINALPVLQSIISALCERNHPRSDDECFPPPLLSADDVMADLFRSESPAEPNRRAPGTWSLQALINFLARRDQRAFLESSWRRISRLDMLSFQPEPIVDGLLWACPHGHEAVRKPDMTQSWKVLKDDAEADRSAMLPTILETDGDFALMFFLAYPHRLSPALLGVLDGAFRA